MTDDNILEDTGRIILSLGTNHVILILMGHVSFFLQAYPTYSTSLALFRRSAISRSWSVVISA